MYNVLFLFFVYLKKCITFDWWNCSCLACACCRATVAWCVHWRGTTATRRPPATSTRAPSIARCSAGTSTSSPRTSRLPSPSHPPPLQGAAPPTQEIIHFSQLTASCPGCWQHLYRDDRLCATTRCCHRLTPLPWRPSIPIQYCWWRHFLYQSLFINSVRS